MKNLLATIFITTSLTACMETADTPKQIAQKYWDAIRTGDNATARQLVSKNSQQHLDSYLALAPEQKITINEINLSEEKATVTTTINSGDATAVSLYEFETTLILENGQWKIDSEHTPLPEAQITTDNELEELAKQLSESMQENVETMDDAVEEGMQLLDEIVQEGSKEMGESLLNLMDELNASMQESIDKMKQRREQKMQPPQQTQPDPHQGEGMI